MRLRDRDVAAIKRAVMQAAGAHAIVRLFGSRLDDAVRGGDIDLHITVPADWVGDDLDRTLRRCLRRELGERAVDVVLMRAGTAFRPIDAIAVQEGVQL